MATAVTTSQDLLMSALVDFYEKSNNVAKILPIIRKRANISLRLLDWFVTNYAKKKDISYHVKESDPKPFNVYLNYKAQLKAFSKRQFDPFCRRERIQFTYDPSQSPIDTTVGQLNFFRWCIQQAVLDYVIDHLKVIEEDMMVSAKKKPGKSVIEEDTKPKDEDTKPKDEDTKLKDEDTKLKDEQDKDKDKKQHVVKKKTLKPKRKELSISASRNMTKQHTRVIVSFN